MKMIYKALLNTLNNMGVKNSQEILFLQKSLIF